MFTQRSIFFYGFLCCVALLVTALYFQYGLGLEPCPLCIFQRYFVVLLGILMLAGGVHNPRLGWRRTYGVLISIVAALGVAVAGRHVWLQNLPPDQVPECGPGLEYMLEAFPLTDALAMVFKGSGECAEVQWQFLGLTIPGWTLLVFLGIFGFGLFLIFSRRAWGGAERPVHASG